MLAAIHPPLARALTAGAALALAAPAAAQGPAAPPDRPALPAAARLPIPAGPTRWSRVTVAGEWAHLGAGPVARPDAPHTAARSLAGAVSVPVGAAAHPFLRVDLGWLRAARAENTAQGATLGVSRPVTAPGVGGRVRLIPGVAAAAGWAETQGASAQYSWRGVPGTGFAGQQGTQPIPAVVRSRMTGVGAQLAAEANLDGVLGRESRGVALAGSVRRWAFRGRGAEPNRRATLVGVGLAVRPAALVYRGGAR